MKWVFFTFTTVRFEFHDPFQQGRINMYVSFWKCLILKHVLRSYFKFDKIWSLYHLKKCMAKRFLIFYQLNNEYPPTILAYQIRMHSRRLLVNCVCFYNTKCRFVVHLWYFGDQLQWLPAYHANMYTMYTFLVETIFIYYIPSWNHLKNNYEWI